MGVPAPAGIVPMEKKAVKDLRGCPRTRGDSPYDNVATMQRL